MDMSLANVLQRTYNEAQVLLEVDSSAILGLISSNQFMSYPQWLCHSFKGCTLPLSFLSQAQEPITQLQVSLVSLHLNRRRRWHPTPVLLPRKSQGRRSLVGCSPWGREESDMTEHFHFSLSCIGEGNGNPLQCSRLENPRDGGTWWAAVYGVAQSRTQLKRLSSSSYI